MNIVTETNLKNVKLYKKGKVRDVYDLEEKLLIVATDRISTFDVVLQDGIPNKGKILTGLSRFWFEFTKESVPNHLITTNIYEFPPELQEYKEILKDRSMLVKKTKPLPIECIVRGYLSGTGWQEYQKSGTVCGIPLPAGLKQSAKLSEPIFTPSTKADAGHDENISFAKVVDLIGSDLANRIKDVCLEIFVKASKYAESKGIIIADTKMEFGLLDNELVLIDELLTPDSSRFWDINEYKVGISPPSFDKQFVRDYLISINWDKKPPIPKLPQDVIIKTQEKYQLAFEKITGKKL
ncbi:MAG: phosphoribosylaminoimidazolesuccinocarboxamide synthase [candidate division WOR-3 bacterium]